MKRIIYVWLAAGVLAGALASFSSAQSSSSVDATSDSQGASLGDLARAARKNKKQESAQRFDNDNLPRTDKLSVVGPAGAGGDDATASVTDAAQPPSTARSATEMPRMAPGQTEDDRQKVIDQWQRKLTEKHTEIDALSQALQLDQREYRIHSAEYYNDPAARVGQAKWGQDENAYRQKIADEQKAIEEAKQKFSDLEEEARHSGVPNSVSEAVEQQGAPQTAETSSQQPESTPPQTESAPEQSESAPQSSESSPN